MNEEALKWARHTETLAVALSSIQKALDLLESKNQKLRDILKLQADKAMDPPWIEFDIKEPGKYLWTGFHAVKKGPE